MEVMNSSTHQSALTQNSVLFAKKLEDEKGFCHPWSQRVQAVLQIHNFMKEKLALECLGMNLWAHLMTEIFVWWWANLDKQVIVYLRILEAVLFVFQLNCTGYMSYYMKNKHWHDLSCKPLIAIVFSLVICT